MKKAFRIFAVLFSLIIVLACCSCETKDETPTTSSTLEPKENISTPVDNTDYR